MKLFLIYLHDSRAQIDALMQVMAALGYHIWYNSTDLVFLDNKKKETIRSGNENVLQI